MQLLLEQLENYLFGSYDALIVYIVDDQGHLSILTIGPISNHPIVSPREQEQQQQQHPLREQAEIARPFVVWSFWRLGRMCSSTNHIQQ
jgi:hypothetical protein